MPPPKNRFARTITSLIRFVRAAFRGLRDWCGDSAYDRYLHSAATRSNPAAPLTPSQFYRQQLDRRYSRPNRCC